MNEMQTAKNFKEKHVDSSCMHTDSRAISKTFGCTRISSPSSFTLPTPPHLSQIVPPLLPAQKRERTPFIHGAASKTAFCGGSAVTYVL
ncbi:hypothetical protein ACTXT7_014303 [Hymenolepis weldensis]